MYNVARWAGRSTRRWREVTVPTVLGRSTVCHWCGHPGADTVDHHPIPLVVLRQVAPHLIEDPEHCAPIHGRNGCPLCPPRWSKRLKSMQPRRCNQEKGAKVNVAPPTTGSRDW